MRVVPCIAFALLTLALAGCGSAPYNDTADKAAIQDVIRNAWQAEYAGDESIACLYYTPSFIEAQNLIWESRKGGPHQRGCASGPGAYHPYLRLTDAGSGVGNDRVGFAFTRISHNARTATVKPILPEGVRCLNSSDCHVVLSLLVHLVDAKSGWMIDDLEASACVVHGSCVPLDNRNAL